jgi:hypothetical protein
MIKERKIESFKAYDAAFPFRTPPWLVATLSATSSQIVEDGFPMPAMVASRRSRSEASDHLKGILNGKN